MDRPSSYRDDDRLDWACSLLARHDIEPGPSGYDEATLAGAVRRRGWDYSMSGVTAAWTAEVFDRAAAGAASLSVAVWEDRETALLLAFAIALDAAQD